MPSIETTARDRELHDEEWAERGELIMVETMQRLGHSESEITRAVNEGRHGVAERGPSGGVPQLLRRVLRRD